MSAVEVPDLAEGEWLIDREIEGGAIATLGHLSVLLQGEGKVWHTVYMHKPFGPGGRSGTERWLVAELDGVRLYSNGEQFILTQKELNL